jgi:hypothetical protein
MEPSLESGFIEMTIPETPTHQDQRYRLTAKGVALIRKLIRLKKKKCSLNYNLSWKEKIST